MAGSALVRAVAAGKNALLAAVLLTVALLAGPLHAEPRCTPVDPSTLIWTGHGFSVTMGDGQVFVTRDDVKYAEVNQPHLCMPDAGLLQLWLPHAWPSYADWKGLGGPPPPPPHGYPTLPEGRITPVHQKLASDAWIDKTKNKKGERCCDAGKDCHSLEPERVRSAPGGVDVQLDAQTIFIPGDQIMVSEDGKYWVCYWGGQIKCFFAPHSGS